MIHLGSEPSASRHTADVLLRLTIAVETYRQRSAVRAGLRSSEALAVFMINDAGSLAQIELADQLGLTSGATTGLIDRLEHAGVVERIRDRSDRRRNQVRLTPAGRSVVDVERDRLDEVFDAVPEHERTALRAKLITVVDQLGLIATRLDARDGRSPVA